MWLCLPSLWTPRTSSGSTCSRREPMRWDIYLIHIFYYTNCAPYLERQIVLLRCKVQGYQPDVWLRLLNFSSCRSPDIGRISDRISGEIFDRISRRISGRIPDVIKRPDIPSSPKTLQFFGKKDILAVLHAGYRISGPSILQILS